MSDNLRLLGKYSAAMESGDTEAVYEFWSPDFVSHVTARVNPERVGSDVRGDEQHWWQQAKSAFPDMTFHVNFDVEPSGERVEINGTAILRIRDGQIVEHWGGPHCQKGLGLIR